MSILLALLLGTTAIVATSALFEDEVEEDQDFEEETFDTAPTMDLPTGDTDALEPEAESFEAMEITSVAEFLAQYGNPSEFEPAEEVEPTEAEPEGTVEPTTETDVTPEPEIETPTDSDPDPVEDITTGTTETTEPAEPEVTEPAPEVDPVETASETPDPVIGSEDLVTDLINDPSLDTATLDSLINELASFSDDDLTSLSDQLDQLEREMGMMLYNYNLFI